MVWGGCRGAEKGRILPGMADLERRRISRRDFLSRAVGLAAFSIVPSHVLAGRKGKRPSDTITRAVIGTGAMGKSHIIWNDEEKPPVTLAVCDVDENHLAAGLKRAGRGCDPYRDFRRVLERKDIDTVHVVTPPHWHALIAIAAMQAGKDVYCEKPVTRFMREGNAIMDAVHRYGRMFQINSYGRSEFVALRKVVAAGLLGHPLTARIGPRYDCPFKVKEWSGRVNLKPEKIPAALDYDMWLGPAPFKPYHYHRVHRSFRGYWDYDGGGLGDMGMHHIDPVQYALGKDETGPATIEAHAPWPPHPDAVGMWGRVTFTYDDGTRIILESDEWGEREKEKHAFIEGPKGKVLKREERDTEPAGLFERAASLYVPPRNRSWDDAVRSRDNSNSAKPNAVEGHRTVTLIHLANIAIRAGRKLNWDPQAERFIGDEAANRFLDVPMRAPWHL